MESRRKAIYKKNLKQTACVSLLLLQVTVKPFQTPCLLDFIAAVREPTRRLWRRHVEKTCRHCFRDPEALTVPEAFFFNFQMLMCIFILLLFDLF
jgi:hypothetical protein